MEYDVSPQVSELASNPPLAPQSLPFLDETLQPTVDQEDNDIFRGEPPPRPSSPAPSSSSSSSSDSSLLGGRFTAIAAVVELAISRWARATSGSSSSSSSSSDSSSTRSSIMTLSRPRPSRRKRRQSSTISLLSKHSERDLAAKFRAREESRQIPREFVLYLPPPLNPRAQPKVALEKPQAPLQQRVSRTSSLPLIIGHLDAALKKSAKARRARRPRARSPERPPPDPIISHHDYMLPENMRSPSRPASFTDLRAFHASKKGKEKEELSRPVMPVFPRLPTSSGEVGINNRAPKSWWLDVSSPTWEDMRAIGKLLHLHPLTLEDILQQDPREKLELFPRLGYYFVSFRAIESQTTRERFHRYSSGDTDQKDHHDDGGVVGEVNVYLVVFREGICSFHFTDIAEHTDRVRNRVTLLEETVNMSSDWIAHGILDSVVDSFFPFLEEVEKEVIEVEDLVFSGGFDRPQPTKIEPQSSITKLPPKLDQAEVEEKHNPTEKLVNYVDEKYHPSHNIDTVKTRFSLPRPTITLFFRRLKRTMSSFSASISVTVEVQRTADNSTATTLRRMARTRRLVTSLTRLLATKSEVVAQIRKRLLTSNHSGLGNGAGKDDDMEVAIYMGDVQDHILTLQHSLAHYERMLSQSHPTYLSQLRVSVASTKSGSDKAIMILTIVSIAVICNQAMIGIFSMNVNLPSNAQEPYGHYYVFGVVVSLVFVILSVYLIVVRRWWLQAKRRRGAVL